jgi:hypothetical protein
MLRTVRGGRGHDEGEWDRHRCDYWPFLRRGRFPGQHHKRGCRGPRDSERDEVWRPPAGLANCGSDAAGVCGTTAGIGPSVEGSVLVPGAKSVTGRVEGESGSSST